MIHQMAQAFGANYVCLNQIFWTYRILHFRFKFFCTFVILSLTPIYPKPYPTLNPSLILTLNPTLTPDVYPNLP